METPDFSKSSFDKLLKPIQNLLRILSKTSPQTFQNKQPKSCSLKLTLNVYLWNSQTFFASHPSQNPCQKSRKNPSNLCFEIPKFLNMAWKCPKILEKIMPQILTKSFAVKVPMKITPKLSTKIDFAKSPKNYAQNPYQN